MKQRKSVTIGIPAFQSGENIVKLLESLLAQKQEVSRLNQIIVYADGCTDDTVKNARSVKNKKILVINSKKNLGFGHGLQTLINKNKSDIFIGLNDDIKIESFNVIDEIVKQFKSKKVGLVGGNIVALQPKSFIGRCIYSSYLVFSPLRYSYKNGKSDLTCDGKIFALSKDYAKTLNLKKTNVGNVDIFLYYENLRQGRAYRFAKKAQVKFRLPETISDFKNQEARAQASRVLMQKYFGELFNHNHKVSKSEYLLSAVKVFSRYPLETVLFKLLIKSFLTNKNRPSLRWKLALSTKKLAVLFSDIGGLESGL